MFVKVLKVSGNSLVVQAGGIATIISKPEDIKKPRIGEQIEISETDYLTGTEYGLDWDIIFPEGLIISSQDLQRSLYAHGLFTLEDLKRNPNVLASAISHVIRLSASSLIKSAEQALGGQE